MNSYWLTITPRLEQVRPGIKKTLDPVMFYDQEMDTVITIEPGFHTDGASVPWPVTRFWSRWDNVTLQASILHDYGYSCRKKLQIQYGHIGKWTKESIDRRFRSGLYASYCDKGRADLYYFCVRHFGFYAWNRPNIEEVKE